MEQQEKNTKVQAMSKSQLASAYGVGLDTFNSWIKPFQEEIKEYRGKVYTPKQVQKIFELLGEP